MKNFKKLTALDNSIKSVQKPNVNTKKAKFDIEEILDGKRAGNWSFQCDNMIDGKCVSNCQGLCHEFKKTTEELTKDKIEFANKHVKQTLQSTINDWAKWENCIYSFIRSKHMSKELDEWIELWNTTNPLPKPLHERIEHEFEDDFKINVYTGVQYEDKCKPQLHPVSEVQKAKEIIAKKESATVYSNSPDFISAIFELCERDNINCEFFLNGKSVGFDIEPIFEDFNKALELISEI